MVKDPYQVLGIEKGASKEEIKRAYRRLVNQYHPDKYRDNPLQDLAQEKLKEINGAYHQLMGDRPGREDHYQSRAEHPGGGSLYQQVRHCINTRRLDEAQELLRQVNEKTAEWFFLQGIIFSHRGFYQQAFQHIERAHTMQPHNPEYQKVYMEMRRAAQQPRSPYSGQQQGGDCDCCTICGTLYCLNCFCECLSGCC